MKLLKKRTPELDEVITNANAALTTIDPGSDEYAKQLAYVERLYRLRAEERAGGINPNTLAIVLGNLAGILIMVGYEHKHVITSKGLGFILKPRVDIE